MELEYSCSWDYGNWGQLYPAWPKSELSDLEEGVKSILSLQFAKEDAFEEMPKTYFQDKEDSFEEMPKTYFQDESELGKRIVKDQQLNRFLSYNYKPVPSLASSYSVSTMKIFPRSPEVVSSNPNPELCVEDVDPTRPKLRELCEKNIPKLRETSPKLCENFEKIDSTANETVDEKSKGDFLDRLVDFEKRISCSDELLEENKRYVNELARRYEEKNMANKKLNEQIGVLMKENQVLRSNSVRLSDQLLRANSARPHGKRKFKFPTVSFGRIVKKISINRLKEKDVDILFSFLS